MPIKNFFNKIFRRTPPEETKIELTKGIKDLTTEIDHLTKDTKRLTREVRRLKKLEFLKVFKHPIKFMGFSLLNGLMFGLGSILGASILVALAIYLLAQISFVPIIGDFVQDIVLQIKEVETIK